VVQVQGVRLALGIGMSVVGAPLGLLLG
jgi:hypothetical protein